MSAEPEMIDDDGPVDFDAELNDFSIGEDYAPTVPPPPSNTPRVKRRVIINEDNNTTQEIPAVGKKKNTPPAAVRSIGSALGLNDVPKYRAVDTDAVPDAPIEGDTDDKAAKQIIITQINELKKKLYVEGSGLRPTLFNTMEQLVAERDLCNTQINSRRGNGVMKGAVIALTPFIEKLIAAVAPADQLDVSSHYHLKDEVKECWGMFEESMTQIAILHASWFAVSPYADVAQCMGVCIDSCNRKNQAVRNAEKSPAASAPNTPQTASNSVDDDNDEDVLQ